MKKIILIAGPCLAESFAILDETATELVKLIENRNIDFYFKSSYKKANRTSINSVSGFGDIVALEWMKHISEKFNIKTITDVHTPEEVVLASQYVDAIQIPAFLARQTELLLAAGNTGKKVNIKKGQFMAPEDMLKAADKIKSTANNDILLTERGTFFGYHDLVVDFRSLIKMRESGLPIIYDATHSVQQPSVGEISGGKPEFMLPLSLAAVSIGIDGIFFETHPNPKEALSDSATQLKLSDAGDYIDKIIKLNNFISEL